MLRRSQRPKRLPTAGLAVLLALPLLSSCSPFYVMRAAYEESKILIRRKDIARIVAEGRRPAEEIRKLKLVLAARAFADGMGLSPKQTFTKYTHVDKDVLAWILVAARPDAFELYTWWFPIVGRVPYKGYFKKEDAVRAAGDLSKRGYETWVRGAETFSTLGWFNDPLVSTTLKQDDARIVETVIHESVHTTLWVVNEVAFNESLANFVGTQAAVEFFADAEKNCGECSDEERSRLRVMQKTAAERLRQELRFGEVVEQLYEALDKLYKSDLPKAAKLEQRGAIFARETAPLHAEFPGMRALKEINNAEIMQVRLYMTGLKDFDRLYRLSGCRWLEFLERIGGIAKEHAEQKQPIFDQLRRAAPLHDNNNYKR